MRRLLLIISMAAFAALLGGCSRDLSSQEAQALLRRVQAARHGLTLDASLTTSVRMQNEVLESEAIVQRAPGIIHVKYLTGRFKDWQVIEQDGLVWRIDPQGKPHASAVGAEPGMNFSPRMLPNLSVRYRGIGLAAGRRVARYEIAMNRPGAPRMELAVDHLTGFPLRLVRRNEAGRMQSATIFRKVNYQAPAPKRLAVPAVASSPHNSRRARGATEEQLTKLLGGPLLKPSYVPAGFKLRGLFIHENPRRRAAEIRYSDGLRGLAVMQSVAPKRRSEGPRAEGAEQSPRRGKWGTFLGQRRQDSSGKPGHPGGNGSVGRSTLRGSVLRERRGNRLVMVVGELPAEELQKVMVSIPYPPGQKPAVGF
ncbi:MAG: hypothetical protein ACYC63_00880 [Armatimonadota bacterium]